MAMDHLTKYCFSEVMKARSLDVVVSVLLKIMKIKCCSAATYVSFTVTRNFALSKYHRYKTDC